MLPTPTTSSSYIVLSSSQVQHVGIPPVLPQQFVTAVPSYPSHLSSMSQNADFASPLATAPPLQLQTAYIPVQQVPIQVLSNPGVQQMPYSVEDVKRLEKKRNFQLQQQRLKEFTIAGKKGSLNAENLLDSMFGKHETRKNPSIQPKVEEVPEETNSSAKVEVKQFTEAQPSFKVLSTKCSTQEAIVDVSKSSTVALGKGVKDLDNLMFQYSNLSGPQKGKTFQKQSMRQLGHNVRPKASPVSRNTVNWNNSSRFNAFPQVPRLPDWCSKGGVAPVYKQVENLVTSNGKHLPNTELFYPILVSSGVPQKVLGEIWELVNCTTPGILTVEEMYAALALAALAQAGHQIKSIDILHQLRSCPTPSLHYFDKNKPKKVSTGEKNLPTANTAKPSSKQHAKRAPVPSLILQTTGCNATVADDDFNDFQSATPIAVNAPAMIVQDEVSASENDDFGDFKQAEPFTNDSKRRMKPNNKTGTSDHDLMHHDEDKYSIFRHMQETMQSRNVGTLCNESRTNTKHDLESEEKTMLTTEVDGTKTMFTNSNADTTANEEEYGEFLIADTTAFAPTNFPQTVEKEKFVADFSKLSMDHENSTEYNSSQNLKKVSTEEFGDFAACAMQKFYTGHEYYSSVSKDSISLAESQSVCSLEFATCDGAVFNEDFKSSLSRQGSVPSLDLRIPNFEGTDVDDSFSDTHDTIRSTSKSPSPSFESNKHSEERPQLANSGLQTNGSLGQPLSDRYSAMRTKQVWQEDEHVNDWIRCLESCLDILQNATKIFNQISCSSVCHEVLSTEEGRNYIKNVIEVYKVVTRISLASKSYQKENTKITQLINDANQAFGTLAVFISGSNILPEDSSFDFSDGIISSSEKAGKKACGICLLNVDIKSKAYNKAEDVYKLTYGGHQYHSSCANLWVNCVEPLLPALTLPGLI